jgi:hypothetical protein
LADRLVFRHFYRHSYSFFLEWDELKPLATRLPQVWAEAKEQIRGFLSRQLGADATTPAC